MNPKLVGAWSSSTIMGFVGLGRPQSIPHWTSLNTAFVPPKKVIKAPTKALFSNNIKEIH
jgi:hypothetical protein